MHGQVLQLEELAAQCHVWEQPHIQGDPRLTDPMDGETPGLAFAGCMRKDGIQTYKGYGTATPLTTASSLNEGAVFIAAKEFTGSSQRGQAYQGTYRH